MTISVATYGAVGNGTTDDTSAIQNALNAAMTTGELVVLEPGKKYKTTSPLIMRQGKTGGTRYVSRFDGQGAELLPAHNGVAINVQSQALLSAPADAEAPFRIANMRINGIPFIQGVFNDATAIQVGRAGYWLDMWDRGPAIENVVVVGYRNVALHIQNARHFDVDRFVVRDPTQSPSQVLITTTENTFTGDITFNDCEFCGDTTAAGNRGKGALTITAAVTSGVAQVRGLRFNSCVFYGNGTKLLAGQNSQINDIWFNNCAWDATASIPQTQWPRDAAIQIIGQHATAQFNQIYFTDSYIVGYTLGALRYDTTLNQANCNAIQFKGGAVENSRKFEFEYARGLILADMQFNRMNYGSGGWAVVSNHGENVAFHDNMESDNAGMQYFLLVGSDSKHNVQGNWAGSCTIQGIQEYTSTGPRLVRDNYTRATGAVQV